MFLSRTSQYAIQGLIYVATQPAGEPVLNWKIAGYLGVPPSYLAKIMQTLCRGNLLYSFRGRQGGFCLREGAEKTDLMRIVTIIEGPALTETCVLGLKVCEDMTPCPMHSRWKPIKEKIVRILREQTLEKLAAAVRTGRYRIADLPAGLMAQGQDRPRRRKPRPLQN
jgi:Rrf2 family protein